MGGNIKLHPCRAPEPLPIINPSNGVPKKGFSSCSVCVFFTLNRSSTRRHPAHPVSVLILHPRNISSVVTSYDTEIMHRNAFDNAMSCPSTGYDRHNIHTSATGIHWKREYEINKNKNKIIIRTYKNKDKNKTKMKQTK